MATDPIKAVLTDPAATGLRDRKKARRRQEILQAAGQLFARNGFDATTIAEIAEDCGVSPPTVFNYFGSKENILSALIFEGTERERAQHLQSPRKTGIPFAEAIGGLLYECTENTMQIAGKRVWRYAEAANIRRPNSEFEKLFSYSDAELCKLIETYLSDYAIVLRSGQSPDNALLARLFYNHWTALYFAYIKDDPMPLDRHKRDIMADVSGIVDMLFDDEFAASSPLKPKAAML
ncbi:TetR/AcrR family transcriptional regulator [Seohaeicola saemankumensis]|nr:TetR/AcrR family transcriptional regulator [Seohaeicola saemankumensis]MCA0869436.1 TetR/AcrR family transcriptional regulator [Seohaeicola saemankumensis]